MTRPNEPPASSPRIEFHDPLDPELARSLQALQRAIITHPVAAQALFYALVREGRTFAETAEGGAWRDRLAASPQVARVRVLWDAVTVRALEDDPEAVLPTAVVEALVRTAAMSNMERVVEDLFIDGVLGGR